VTVDVAGRRLHAHLSDDEIAERLRTWTAPRAEYPRGYNRLYAKHVRQAHEGCDFDFLEGAGGIGEPEIH
jgi:dihydroxy-acid dehydratase